MTHHRLVRSHALAHHLPELRALAVTFLSFGQVVKARAVLSVALAIDPEDPATLVVLDAAETVTQD